MNPYFQLAEIERRLANLLRIGLVADTDPELALIKVQVGELETGWVPWLTSRAGNDKTWWSPSVGEQVLILSPGGDMEHAVVLPALYQGRFPAPNANPEQASIYFADGATLTYDKSSHAKTLTLPSGGTVAVDASGGIALRGDVTIEGNLQVSGGITGEDTLSITGAMQGQATLTVQGAIAGMGPLQTAGAVTASGGVGDGTTTLESMKQIYNTHTHVAPEGKTKTPEQTM